jgi:hypothetical protein
MGLFQVTASGYPEATFTATGTLPRGVTFYKSGALNGTPAAGTGGTYTITVSASDGVGSAATQSFNLTIKE